MRIPITFISIALLALHLSAPAQVNSNDGIAARPMLNRATPEECLKSYWALKEWVVTTHRNLGKELKGRQVEAERLFLESLDEVTAGETLRWFREVEQPIPDLMSRTIVATSFEGPNKAQVLVNIKNVTPIPSGARPSQIDMERRLKGKNFKYVVTLGDGGWKISEVWADEPGGSLMVYERGLPRVPVYVFWD